MKRQLSDEERKICEKQLERHKNIVKEVQETLKFFDLQSKAIKDQRKFQKLEREYKEREKQYNEIIRPYLEKQRDEEDERNRTQTELTLQDSQEQIKILTQQLKEGVEVKSMNQ